MICEQLGEEPDPKRMPIEEYMFPTEVQLAFLVHDYLPDRWDGMSGTHLGKDWSALAAILDVYNIEDKVHVTFFLKYIDVYNSQKINKELERRKKQQELKGPDASGGIHVQG